MRMFIILAVTVAIVAIGFGVKTAFTGRSADHAGSMTKAMETSKTISPHEIHLNYKAMKELPVNEVKEPF
jgi:flagellar basal body-associated protein FliL